MHGHVERRAPVLVLCLDRHPCGQKHFRDCHLPASRGSMERGEAGLRRDLWLGALFEQQSTRFVLPSAAA